jgi:hypothetical protein
MKFIWNLVAHSHLVVTVCKTLLKLGKGLLHSNLGFLGLDRVFSFFGWN